MLWNADPGDGRYTNPILHTDYSDPDVIRVGSTFYMTASSFNYVPGLPILTSRDLVTWKLVNYAVSRIPFPDYDKPAPGRGIWAPSIRYHAGQFWIFVGMPDEGIFVTTAADPLGRWSALTCIREGKGFIDPCPLWDDDGRAWVVHAYAKSRIGFKSKLGIFPIEPGTGMCCGEDRFIFDGTLTQPTIEGPKIYKRGDWYWIFAPAGGVAQGWQTALRSRNIFGPYEERIVMHQGSTGINGPHQGGLVDTPDGGEWFIHFQDKGAYGRVCHLQPVRWADGWPVIGSGTGPVGEPVSSHAKPLCVPSAASDLQSASDSFDSPEPGLQWQWPATPPEGSWSLTARPGWLRLPCLPFSDSQSFRLGDCAQLLTQKLVCPAFRVKTLFSLAGMAPGDRAGLAVMGLQYRAIQVERTGSGYSLSLLSGDSTEMTGDSIMWSQDIPASAGSIILRLECGEGAVFSFSAGVDDRIIVPDSEPFAAVKGAWVGTRLALYAVCDPASPDAGTGYVDVGYFSVTSRDAEPD